MTARRLACWVLLHAVACVVLGCLLGMAQVAWQQPRAPIPHAPAVP